MQPRTFCASKCPSVTLRLLATIYGKRTGMFHSEHSILTSLTLIESFLSVVLHLPQLDPCLDPSQRRASSDCPKMEGPGPLTPLRNTNLLRTWRNGRGARTDTGFVRSIVKAIQSTGGMKTLRSANDGRGWSRSPDSGGLFGLLWISPSYGSSSS